MVRKRKSSNIDHTKKDNTSHHTTSLSDNEKSSKSRREVLHDKLSNIIFYKELDADYNGVSSSYRTTETVITVGDSDDFDCTNLVNQSGNSSHDKIQPSTRKDTIEKVISQEDEEVMDLFLKGMVIIGGVNINTFPGTAGHIKVSQSFIDIELIFPLSPVIVILLDHWKRALS